MEVAAAASPADYAGVTAAPDIVFVYTGATAIVEVNASEISSRALIAFPALQPAS